MADLLLALDQGTTGSTAVVVDVHGNARARANVEFPQHFPKPGWVEHDPAEIWLSVGRAVETALAAAHARPEDLVAIGITNQRETTLIWDRKTGAPIHRAIVWQDRRTAEHCTELRGRGLLPTFVERTGLVLDPYFSGTKIRWILDAVPGARRRAEAGELAFGTVESFLVHKLTGGDAHVSDVSNASRTLLLDIRSARWDEELCRLLDVPTSLLPELVGNAEPVGRTRGVGFLPDGIPITGLAGDQQAALFGQTCFRQGDVKCTYGTGAFVLMNVGETPVTSASGLLGTIAYASKRGAPITYALEGSAFIAGAAVQWLRDGLRIIDLASQIEPLARSVSDAGGVYFVPALTGLGAPYWDPDARGLLCGLTRGTGRAHIARATLEAIAHEVADLIDAMASDLGARPARLRVDGGASANGLLLELQAAYAQVPVERPRDVETTARGAAMLAALGVGAVDGLDALRSWSAPEAVFGPRSDPSSAQAARAGWKTAVARARGSIPGTT
jgi:glycerol kinase